MLGRLVSVRLYFGRFLPPTGDLSMSLCISIQYRACLAFYHVPGLIVYIRLGHTQAQAYPPPHPVGMVRNDPKTRGVAKLGFLGAAVFS